MTERGPKIIRKLGGVPGSALYTGSWTDVPISLTEFRYDKSDLAEVELPLDRRPFPTPDGPEVVWLNLDGLHDESIVEEIGVQYGIHPLVIEDVLNVVQRPKVEPVEGRIFVSVRMVRVREGGGLDQEQVSIVLAPGVVISFQEHDGDAFEPVRDRIRGSRGRIRNVGPDYLFYALVDAVVDAYFVVLDQLTERVEDLEESIYEGQLEDVPAQIRALRSDSRVLRRAVRPMREALEALLKDEHELLTPMVGPFFKDALDHVKQLIDGSDVLRESLIELGESYRAELGSQSNEVMKALTIVATLFIPLTFVAGIYGMNFSWMPELGWKWSYPVVWLVMIGVTIGMLRYFRKKGWI